MNRREFVGLIGAGGLGFSRMAHAQTRTDLPLVGLLIGQGADTTLAKDRVAWVRKGLQQEGFVEGTNYSLAVRYADGNLRRYPELARELGALNARVIVVIGFIGGMKEVGERFPGLQVVFTAIAADLVGTGVIQSYARPGGMITGNVMNAAGGEETMAQKRIELFKGLVPDLKRLGMISSANLPGGVAVQEKAALEKVSARLGFEFVRYGLKTIDDLEGAVASGLRDDVSAFYVSGEALMGANMPRVVPTVVASGKPAVGSFPDWGRAGLLMSYGPDLFDGFRHAGTYAAKILKGAKAGELPVEQASRLFVRHQPQDREGARHRRALDLAGACRRGDRMKRRAFIRGLRSTFVSSSRSSSRCLSTLPMLVMPASLPSRHQVHHAVNALVGAVGGHSVLHHVLHTLRHGG